MFGCVLGLLLVVARFAFCCDFGVRFVVLDLLERSLFLVYRLCRVWLRVIWVLFDCLLVALRGY